MRCRQATRFISDSHERQLTSQEKFSLRIHLMTCSHCRNFRQNCTKLRHLMKEFAENSKQ